MRKIKDFFYKLRRFIKRLIYLSELWEKEEKENAVKDVRRPPRRTLTRIRSIFARQNRISMTSSITVSG